jgi:hypothetical protein
MPKIKNNLMDFSGKIDELVFVNSNRYGPHVRKRPNAASKKNQEALQQNNKRTAYLNLLASDINRIIGIQSEAFKHPKFYFELQKRFRGEPSDNRFLLLKTLQGLDVHPRYTLAKVSGVHEMHVHYPKQKINVEVIVKEHPQQDPRTNCYSFELLLITWNQGAGSADHQLQVSEWVHRGDPKPVFEFSFRRGPKTVHWILCLGLILGWNGQPVSLKTQGIRIVLVGTFIKKEMSLISTNSKKFLALRRSKPELVRVKAKRTH